MACISCATDASTCMDDCMGATVPMDADGWQMLMSDLENLITSGYTVATSMFLQCDMFYLNKAANSAKCAVLSGFINCWYLLGSAYYFLDFIGKGALMEDNINLYYPTVCSCLIEVEGYIDMLAMMASNLFSFGAGAAADPTDCLDANGSTLYVDVLEIDA